MGALFDFFSGGNTLATGPNSARKNRFQWTIARKIGGLAMVLMMFILALLIYSIVSLREMQMELKEIAELDVPLTELVNHIEIQQLEQQITLHQLLRLHRRAVLLQNQKEIAEMDVPLKELANKIEIQQLEEQITLDQLLRLDRRAGLVKNQQVKYKQQFRAHSEALNRHIKMGILLSKIGFQTEFRSMFESIHNSLLEVQLEEGRLYHIWKGIVKKIDSGVFPDSQVVDDALSQEEEFDEKILNLIQKIELFTERELSVLEKHNKLFFMVNLALGISGVIIGSFLSLLVIFGIRSNLFRLSQRISEVTKAIVESGSISTALINIKSSDEIGKLARKLSVMLNRVSVDFEKRDELSRYLKQVATSDQLTGAFNRLKWEENQALEIERVRRNQDELSLIFFDIDFFKKVNDTFGHDVGDQVLIEIVREAGAQIRKTDSLYRTGGEEFVILAPNTTQEQAGIVANKVRQAIEEHDFETVGRVTVSMGCAQFDKKSEDGAAQMFKRADEALYRAKESGRNRVVISA